MLTRRSVVSMTTQNHFVNKKFEKSIDFERKLQDLFKELKITQIGSISMEKSKSEVRERKSCIRREKMIEIHLI